MPTPALAALADRIVARFGVEGWCALDLDGRVHTGGVRPSRIALDGHAVAGPKLPPGWHTAGCVHVDGVRGPLLGSPLPVHRLIRLEGFVERRPDGLVGWAYHPADLERAPVLRVQGRHAGVDLCADDPADGVTDLPPLARPRRFALTAAEIAVLGDPVAVLDRDGRHLLGSPLYVPATLPMPQEPPRTDRRPRAVDVVVPVYGGRAATLACLDAVLACLPAGTRVHVIDDASPDPALVTDLNELARSGRIRLTRHAENRGFPATANVGLRDAAGRDVVLLNSDAIVPPGWLDRLRRAAYASGDIGTATPLSNDATLLSYPSPDGGNEVPRDPAAIDRIAQRANPGMIADLPVGVGFCLYMRRDCLDQTGLLREDAFAQGYGEESDFCRRAAHAGWRHVAALDVFVTHLGQSSFPGAGRHLNRRNQQILNRLHPGYAALVARHQAADPLFHARRRMDALRFQEGRQGAAALLVSHDGGGGVTEFVAHRCAAIAAEGRRAIALRPSAGGCSVDGVANLRFALPAELDALVALLEPERPVELEAHHLLGHDHAILALADRLHIPVSFWIHDAAAFCPRISLIGRDRRYCGEPDPAACERCVADLGSHLREPITVPALLARSAADFARAARIVVPTRDAARRLVRHFPGTRPEIVPWEADPWETDPWEIEPLPDARRPTPAPIIRICVVGAIGVEKGFDVLHACAEDARRRELPLEFVLCGHSEDDAALLVEGVFVIGPYVPGDATALIRAQRAHLAFIPSIWPETWCFALTRAWQAGLPAVAFDLGAPAERIRATGRGALLPLALPPASVNDALLRLARPASSWHRPQP